MQKSRASDVFGFVLIIGFGGCGTESGRPPIVPTETSATHGPSLIEPGSESPTSARNVNEKLPTESKINLPLRVLIRAPAIKTSDPELDPLVSYLKASFEEPMKDGHRLVITLVTGTNLIQEGRNYQEFIDLLLKQASTQVPAEMIRDFGEKNRGSSPAWPELTNHLLATLITNDEHDEFFKGPGDAWDRFYAKYPDAYGIIGVSRVGLNQDKTVALVYIEEARSMFFAHGRFHVLKKHGDMWVELPINFGVIWNA